MGNGGKFIIRLLFSLILGGVWNRYDSVQPSHLNSQYKETDTDATCNLQTTQHDREGGIVLRDMHALKVHLQYSKWFKGQYAYAVCSEEKGINNNMTKDVICISPFESFWLLRVYFESVHVV